MLLSTDYQADVALPPIFITFDHILGRDFFYPNNQTHFPNGWDNTHIPHLLDTLVQIIFEIVSFMLLYIFIRHDGKFAST